MRFRCPVGQGPLRPCRAPCRALCPARGWPSSPPCSKGRNRRGSSSALMPGPSSSTPKRSLSPACLPLSVPCCSVRFLCFGGRDRTVHHHSSFRCCMQHVDVGPRAEACVRGKLKHAGGSTTRAIFHVVVGAEFRRPVGNSRSEHVAYMQSLSPTPCTGLMSSRSLSPGA